MMFPDEAMYIVHYLPSKKLASKIFCKFFFIITWYVLEANTLGSVNLEGGLLVVMVIVCNKQFIYDKELYSKIKMNCWPVESFEKERFYLSQNRIDPLMFPI